MRANTKSKVAMPSDSALSEVQAATPSVLLAPAPPERMRTRRRRPSTRESVAHHEAGHVVALVVICGAPARATIVPEPDALGRVTPHWFQLATSPQVVEFSDSFRAGGILPPQFLRAFVLGRVWYVLGGWAAESIYRSPERLVGVTRYIDPDQDKARAMIAALYPSTNRMYTNLVTSWTMSQEYRRVRAWLREHWQHVEAVAQALLDHDEIDEDQIREILDALPWMRHPTFR